jgi:hypothetical protein
LTAQHLDAMRRPAASKASLDGFERHVADVPVANVRARDDPPTDDLPFADIKDEGVVGNLALT